VKRDPRVDAFIAKAAPFARPVLKHLRAIVHATCPDASETIKWGFPAYDFKGPLCGFAAFKEHCTFGMWKYKLIPGLAEPEENDGMGQFGRITRLSDLPAKRTIARYLTLAMRLNDDGVKVPRKPRAEKPEAKAPADLLAALAKNKRARAHYDAFPPGQRREYVAWIEEAKRPATRAGRIETAVAWMAEGKYRNWKYERRS
jgi:uncharacterized protein YdeI (YjbR/CyaY-like superfamily)